MSDYAGNLVGRAMGTMPTVQPRVASRFAGAAAIESSEAPDSAAAPAQVGPRAAEIRVVPSVEVHHEVMETRTPEERQVIVQQHRQTADVRSEIRTEIRQAPTVIIPPPTALEQDEEAPALLVPSWQPPPQVMANLPGPESPKAQRTTAEAAQSAAQPAAQPIVRIHINRIEVRAPQQPAGKPVQATPVPSQKPMSLDTYLRSRQGSSR